MENTPGSSRTVSWSPGEYAIKIRELLDAQEAELNRLTDALWEDHEWRYINPKDGTGPWISFFDRKTGEYFELDV